MPRPFRFAVYAYTTASRQAWEETARRTEALGYSTLMVPDHFRNPLPPVAALVAAAAATTTLRLSAIVFANDYRHPALLAKEAAALDLLSDGRFEFGIGAGWHQEEYEQVGLPFDRAGVRIARMVEGLHIIRGLWGEGEFSYNGSYYTISGLDGTPKPVQQPHPPIFIGGSGPRILAVAAREADIVGVLPTPLPRGGHNWVGSTDEVLAERVGWVREAAGECFDRLELSGIAFRAIPTERPATVAAELATEYGLTPEQLLASPDFLIGSETEMVEQLLERRARFAISYVEIPERDTAAFAPVVARLAGH